MTRSILRLVVSLSLAAAIAAAQDNSLVPPDIQANVDRIRGELRVSDPQPSAPAAQPAQTVQIVTPEELEADADDDAILLRTMRTVNVDDLVLSAAQRDAAEQDVKDMLGAAERMADRIDRREARVKDLATQGVVSGDALITVQEEATRRHETLDLVTERAAMLTEVIEMARMDELGPGGGERRLGSGAIRYDGAGRLIRPAEMATLSAAFQKRFSRPLPVSAWGESSVHEMMGFDHRGRIDVAVYPDGPEGRWIRAWLERLRIPYYAFLTALPGRSTGAHIHIGPGSTRIQALSRGRTRRRPAAD